MRETPARRGPAQLAIGRPVGTLSIASVVFALGLFFADRLPIDLLPDVERAHIRATVNYPGTAPEVMEEQITRVLERNLAATEGLERIYSRASEGRTNVNLILDHDTNIDLALQDASRHLELARTQMPADIEAPRLYKFDPAQDPIWQAGFSSRARSEVEVRDWVEHQLAPHLLALGGVSSVEAAGAMERELEVVVDQERLATYGLSMREVATALEDENVDIAGGWVTSETFDVMAVTDGLLTSAEEVEQLSIPLPEGGVVRLGDVARARDGHARQRMFARLDGSPATQLSVFKLPEANTAEVAGEVEAALERLERSGFIPEDMEYEPIGDEAAFVRGAISSVATAAVLGGALAMIVVFFFLGSLRKSAVVGLSIPIALSATFALLGASGLTLNIISLGGLALGVGLLLDNAIVMLENIDRHREEGEAPPEEAARDGAAEVSSAIVAGTLTNLAAVAPFLLITGMAALIFRELILTISFAILATLGAALTVIPTLAALLARVRFRSGLAESAPLRAFRAGFRALARAYQRALSGALRYRWLVLLAAVAALAGSLRLAGELGDEFLPQVDDGGVYVRVSLPPGTTPADTDAAARAVERELEDMQHVEGMFSLVGGHLGGGIVNERPGTARFRVQLSAPADRPDTSAGAWVASAQERLDALDLPGARISVHPPRIRGLRFTVTGDDLSIGVVGGDLEESRALAREIVARVEGVPGLEGAEVGREDQSPLLRVLVDRERAAALGVRAGEIGRTVRRAVEGEAPTTFSVGDREYDIRVRAPREAAEDSEALGDLPVFRDGRASIPLRDVASFELGEGPAHIERENQSRVVRVNADVNTEIADVGAVMAAVEDRLEGLELPDDYSLIFGGAWETIEETQREMASAIALALFLVFVVLAVQYERVTNPLVILAAAPMSLIGVVGLLWLTGTPQSAPVLIGVVLLVGVVVNNAILLVEYVEIGRRRGHGIDDAIAWAGGARFRPIVMTTATTALGMTPLALGLGEGAEIMRPLALTVIGGLSGAMVLTLFVVPCLYLVVTGGGERLARWVTGDAPRGAGSQGDAAAAHARRAADRGGGGP